MKIEMVYPLLQWYDRHARILPWRENPRPYAVWISEIMLQQTRVEAVKPYFDRWLAAFPDLPALAAAPEERVLKLWEGLGYYSRARNIHKTARLIMEKYGGCLPASFEGLRSLPGIGEYTAGAIGSIAFQLPVPCVDGNVLRVVARLTGDDSDIGAAETKRRITGQIQGIIPRDRPGDFNQAMMELGATVCLPNGAPKCELCPLAFLCQARIQDRTDSLPVKSGKAARKKEQRTILVLLNREGRIALRKRPETGLLAGLWEFPSLEGVLDRSQVEKTLDSACLKASSLVTLKKAKHIFTHIEWHMTGYLAELEAAAAKPATASSELAEAVAETDETAAADILDGVQWVDVRELEAHLALPAAFKAYYQDMKHYLSKDQTNIRGKQS